MFKAILKMHSKSTTVLSACGNLLKVHVSSLQGAVVWTLSVQFTAQLLGLALVLLEISS